MARDNGGKFHEDSRFTARAKKTGPLIKGETGKFPKGRATSPLSPIERRAHMEAEPDYWGRLEQRRSEVQNTFEHFLRRPSVDHIDAVEDLLDDMGEAWNAIAEQEIEKIKGTLPKDKNTPNLEKLFRRFEILFNELLNKNWRDLPRQDRSVTYYRLFATHKPLHDAKAHHVAKLMQKARIAFQEVQGK